jgi:hypothetical protein
MAVAATAHVDLPNTKSFLGITGSASDQILERCIDRASAWVDRYCGRVFKSQRHYEIKEGGGERLVLRHQPVTAVHFVGTSTETMLTIQATAGNDILATASVMDGSLILRRIASDGTLSAVPLPLDTYATSAALAAEVTATAGFSATVGINAASRYLVRSAATDCRSSGAMLGYTQPVTEWQLDEERGIIYGRSVDQWRSVLVDYQAGYETVPADVVQATLLVVGKFFRDRTRDASVQSESLGGYSYSLRAGDETAREIEMLLGAYRRIR